MIIRNRDVTKAENIHGGKGFILRDHLIQGELLHGKCTYCACITLDPECEIGLHQHVNDSELYYLIEGDAIYNDNGVEVEVHAGDALFCKPGERHAIRNETNKPVVFVAMMQEA